MNLTELLENLSAKNVELWVDGDKLRYRSPENVLTPELLGLIKQYKPEIIRILSQVSDDAATYSLSHGQKALWFLYQLAPESVAYNVTYAAFLVTNLEISALQQAAQALVERHPVLRTTFTTIDGEPVQTVHENHEVDFSVEEAFALDLDDVNNWLKETCNRPFNLELGPILRLRVLINHTATKEHILLITKHHIVSDFWSLEIMLGELKVLYEAITKDIEPLLPAQKCQYRDYVKWSEQMLTGSEGERLWTYWEQQLSGELPVLNLPTDRPRPQSQTYNGADCFFDVEEKLRQNLTELAEREGASLYTVFLTTLQILLFRYTNQEDILIGSPMVNRSRSEFEKIVGYFTNPVVLRGDLSGNPTFVEMLKRSRLCVLNALDHQEYPFPLLVERLQPVRDNSFSPLYQVALAWDRSHQSDLQVSLMGSDGLIVESMMTGAKGAAFDLTLTILEEPGTLKGIWNYNTDLFECSTIERMMGHFVTMLSAIVANPQERISQLPLLTASESQQLLVEWNRTHADYPQDKCIHHLFEEQSLRTPDAVAVVFENQQLTYGELNAKANQLAHYLRSLGVSADVLVGICVERSVSMVVGLLGILKAGGAYVPLDPEHPQERLSFILCDAQVAVLLTQQHIVEKLPQHHAQLVCLDTNSQLISQSSQQNPITGVHSSNLAYVIYTSGSTGLPKGVQISHDAVSNFLSAMEQRPGITKQDILLGITTIAFDIAGLEIFLPITVGACLVIAHRDVTLDGRELLDLQVLSQATIMQATPATWRLLLEANYQSSHLKVLCGGEAIPWDLANQLRERSACLWNLYGPTEATIWSSVYQVESKESLIPIGRPISNTQLYILDQNLQPVPVGVSGELHIGGASLARGYLNRPELTAEKFIPNPFDKSKISKLYKTGDLARYLPDGNIEYLGRIDNQVKIRGFRIEPGEIEAVLGQHEHVKASCVIARVDTTGYQRLVAYIVPQPEQTPTVSQLRAFLSSKLPEYMVPNVFVFLESLPLTPNGKVDRRALPTPDNRELQDKFVAPRTPTEEMLALLWAQVLKVELVGRHDNFFTLGGHSLLATQVVSRIRTVFKVELPLRSLFATATVAELALSIQQQQLENVELTFSPILPRVLDAEIPLSFAQQRLWFLDQLELNSALYNIPMALRLVGNLNVAALQQSLEEIIHRHEALRTNFITVDGKASQIIQVATNWTVSVVDLQDLSTTEQEIASQVLAQQQAIQPIDMSCAALIRATLVVLSETEHVLNVCMHHIVSDGWSMGVFVEELAALYNAYSQGLPSPLVPLPIQYADFAQWQRQWLQGSVLESQLSYWLQQLANAPTFLPLPTDRPRSAVQTFAGAHQEFALSVELTQKLTKLSQSQGCTLFMTLLALFNTLLYRYTGQTDILVGTPIANRERSEIEGLIGFFVNTLVMRTDLSGNPSFSELLTRVREMALSAYAHQDLPFEMLVEALQPDRDLSHTPLFQVMFALQNAPMSEFELTGLRVSSLPIETATAKFDLTLSMENTHTGLVCVWEYNTDLFDGSTIERMTGHFVTMLEAIVANPQEHLAQLPLLTASESQQLLVEWNETWVDYPQDKCIHHLFEEQSLRTPDAVAVVFENQQLTYGELNAKANQLAHYLRSLGVSADVLVGLCVERSLFMLVGLLGILKAGGAYVPLDPEYPQDRLLFMLQDTQVSVLLTQQSLQVKLPKHQATQVFLDQNWSEIAQNNQVYPTNGVTGGHLANVIYTSGSTGLPKGVMVEHRGLCNLALAQEKAFGLHCDSRVLQFASLSFDASIWEVIMAFGAGATLYLGTKDSLMPGMPLIEQLRDCGITHITLPPSALAVLPLEELPALSTLIVAGEACAVELMQQWSTARNFFNAYGPTEASVCATIAKCTPKNQKISIGRPISNTQVYILDSDLQPVPVGVPGELHIGGASLARGYLNRPELTEEKFIPNPFDKSKISKLYKTGDLARYLPDGNIEYLGRIDNQVKIRGFRIEPGEIEAVLGQHEHVKASCVIARVDTTGYQRLVAYIVPQPEQTPTVSELRAFLKEELPDYMVPNVFVFLESLPLTPNGKVDRRALPTPDIHSQFQDKFVAPRTPTEEMLALLWAQVLKVELVGRHDNFFTLGGHSLLATQVVSRIRTVFKVELPLRSLFATATVAELALSIQQQQLENVELTFSPILPRVLDAEIPLSFAQQRLWFLDQLELNSALYNIPMALRLVGNLNVAALQQSLEEIIHRHEALRTNFITVDGKASQIIQVATNWTVSVVDLQDLSTTEQEIASQVLAQQQAIQPIDMSCAALIRATLVVLSETEHVLNVCMHHIVSDGWSMGVFVEELAALYNAYSQGLPSPLVPLPIQYADFAQWQRQWLQGSVLESQLSYWLQQLANAPTFLPLPTDRPRSAVQTFAGAHQEFALSVELTQKLTKLSQSQGCTLFMTLLALFNTLLYRYTGQTDILVGTPIANRERSEIEGLIGFFVNTLVMRTDLSGNPSFSELLTRVREMALSAYAHQDLPFEMLVEALQPDRDLSHTPLFQVMFALQNAPMSEFELTGLRVSSLPIETATAKFDLTLSMENTHTGLVCVWEYNTDLFDGSTIERMTGHFVTMLEAIVANPQEHLAQLPLLTASESQQLLVEWNETWVDYPQDKCIHHLFEEQSLRTPDAVAVVFEDVQTRAFASLTYHQLNAKANQLAHYLRSLGVSADVLVGICVERSLEMVVGLLGILKAGGAYVPLDPSYPTERLSLMLEDAQVSVLLTQQQLVEYVPQNQARVVCLDTDWEKIAQKCQSNHENTTTLDNLAYVIYTSGSTGKPKGVLVNHSNVVRLFAATNCWYNFNAQDVWTLFHSYAFDFSVWEIWGALLYGGRLVVVPYLVTRSPESFLELLCQEKITILNQTPSAFRQLISAEQSIATIGELNLRFVIFGGEALELSSLQPWFERHGDQSPQLVNMYGITETTVHVTYRPLCKADLHGTASVIGRPIGDLQVYVLDEYKNPVPIGVPGEMYVGGEGVSRGYLNRHELTQQRFISNPFSLKPQARLYKTGDKARYLPNGELEYLGRIDNQVKIRGFRIEPGEIEAVLGQHEHVKASCVIARVDTTGYQRLVAYIVPQPEQTPTVSQLRAFLSSKLPEYMVPNVFVFLESLPLTPNGKVDRRALPTPDIHSQFQDKFVAPRTPTEEMLALLWAQVLKVELVGRHDNFFTLGGHSLLATQVVSRIRTVFKVELPLRSLFATATVAELALSIQQQQLENVELTFSPILPRVLDAEIPLSFAQQRLWFLDQLELNSALYNIPMALRLVGNLNVAALQQSLEEIIHRHEALRTNFITVDGKASQIIQVATNWTVSVVDLQDLSTTEQEIASQVLAQQQAIQPIDMSCAALIRATLVVLSETEHVLNVCMHHIVSDGWSMGVFVEELAALYNAYSQGLPSPLVPLPIQYADFAQWQRQWLQGSVLESQLSYWLQQLANAPTFLPLPTDRPRSAVQTFAGAHQEFALSVELTQKLTKLSQSQGCTLFMTLLALFNTLLYRYTGQTDILVGTPIANRERSEIEGLIGFFVNTLVMRTDLSGNPSFSELLTRVREMALSAYAHQDLPFEMLVEALQPDRDLSHTPLFQVMFALQNAPMSEFELTGLRVSSLPIETATAKFDLTLSMENTHTGLVCVWEYNTDLFDGSTIERMTGHFVTMLEAIVANPQEHLAQLPLLTASESQQLLVEWNETWVDYPQDKCIHHLFEEQSLRTPDAVAVVFEDVQTRAFASLTYHQLNAKANQLAHYLRSLGVSADVLVGICVERSLEMVVGLLGILKAGGAYVPLDPSYPTERLSLMLEDAQVSVLLTQQQLVEYVPQNQARVVCLDTDWEKIAQKCQSNHENTTTLDNLAYVIYTSGSTGKPKGVLVNHSNVVRLFAATNCWYNFNAQDVWTLFHSYAFDFSVWEIWGALLYGGRLVVVPYLVTRSPESFLELLCQEKITILNQTPSAFRQLISAEQSIATIGELNLRFVIFGGEALELSSLQPWFERHGDQSPQLVNMYGITETTVHVTYRPLCKADLHGTASVIGRPIGDLQVYVLDEYKNPVPIGVPGEMYVGGEGVSRGYLNRHELTQQRFISNPFSLKPQARLYKTGDKARYLPNGELEYLGRIDNQVKIRGFRIEPGEIEAVLGQHEHVKASCVIARVDTTGDQRLVAYIVPQPEQTPTVSQLRAFLSSKLPEYMVPNVFVFLESLPLTPNGKVDRRALPTPDIHSQVQDKFVAPRTPTEEMLALLWAQVLKVELVGRHDNFFTLGGHSLLATQVVSRIRTVFKVELPLRSLFATATVAELALSIQQQQLENVELTFSPILPRVLDAEIPLSFAQQRLWFLDQLESNSALYNIPMALRLVGNLNVAALQQSLEEIIHRHEALRTNFITVDGKASQIIQVATNWTVSVVDLQHLSTTEQEIASQVLAQQQAIQPIDMSCAALIRATLVVLSETEHVLNVCMHHIVSDGWSMGVFVEELATLYNAYSQGLPSPLVPLPIQYADFALWQRQWLQGSVLQSQLSYWLQQLANAPTFLPLPTDRPRSAVQTFAGAHQEFALSVELTQKLTKLSQSQGCTLFMTLLALFNTLLYRYTGQTDILVGTPIANRERSEIEGLIGFFVNTLVMRTDLSGNPSFSELLTRVREMALSAYAHQDLPFEMLVEALQPDRDLSHTPLFQVMFALQNAPMSEFELTGLRVSSLPIETATAKFDLTLSMENTHTGLVCVWEYNTDLFDGSTIERMTGHFVTMLEAIVANPQEHLAQLPLLTASESQQLLVEWNETWVDYPQDKCIHHLFEEQSLRTPDAVAVVFENQQLTYGELNAKANQLAHYLRSLGVSADVLVGLCVERSLFMLVGLLGILKAGGAYVPLDPEYPQDRLLFMLQDTQVSVLLTQQSLQVKLPKHQATQVFLDQNWSEIAQNNQVYPTNGVTGGHLANVIYTSGSTGLPKGVMVEHRGLCNLALAQEKAFGLHCDSRVLQFASLSFDASIWEVIMAFGAGATLYLGTKDSLMPGMPLIEQLRDCGITHITLPPSALAVLPLEELPALSTLIVAGEACAVELMQQWSTARNFFNAYGPTEASVCATIAKCTPKNQKISIGRPISNTQVYILDSDLQPVPVGVPGELHIGGASLARGYLNRPELTEEKFIPNPFDKSKISKLYKTGDLARYLPDGNIEYLGRIDNQVKIRGFRIEPGEIEAVLGQHEHVKASCVIARVDTTGDQRLVAYIVPQPEQTPTVSELRAFLKEELPDYMVPNVFVFLESLPLTPNGKVDRRALPTPDNREVQDKFVAPRTPTEEMLALLWAQVLKVELVGRHDNFFTLGGHSLLATQVVSRIRTLFKVELPLRSLFATATVAELALSIQQQQLENVELTFSPILPRVLDAEIPLSFAQQRLWFLDQLELNSALYNIPMALRLVGNLNVAALQQSLEEIIHRHEALRTNFITVDGKASQIIQVATNWTVSVVDLQDLSTTEQEIASQVLAQQQAIQPIDMSCAALIRATLVVLSETEHVLNVCMHHIVSDGWSMGVFVEELAALYNAYSQGLPSPLVPLPIQYADFAQWQRQWLQGSVLESQLSYWLQQLANAPTFLPLPTDRPRSAVQTFAGAHQEFALSVELTQKLTKLSQSQGCTLFMTLLALFNTLLYRYTGQTDILVGTPIANRERSEIEGLIGFFVNTLVMRTDLSGNPSFSELLTRVREMALSAYAHQDLPFEMLVEALQPDRDLSHTPLFQVMFALQNAPMSEFELTGLRVSSLPIETATAKFDLTLSMENTHTGLVCVWEYNTDLFDGSTIERMTGHFVTMLEAIVANPQEHLAQLPLLTASESQQLLVEWNETWVDYPQDKCIHHLFEEQSLRTPDAVAVVFENEQLTYGELNCRANQLAHYLKSLGVSADVLVGICVERSLLMVVGLLGILKAGGAYVPLDPEYPTERLRFMLEDTQARVLLTQQQLLESLPQHQVRVVHLDTDWRFICESSQESPITEVRSSNLAYVIYTSGSTGQPKGVMLCHSNLCNHMSWMQAKFGLTEKDKVLQKTPFGFDASVWEFYAPLLVGGQLLMAQPGGHTDSAYLLGLIAQQQVTTVQLVPSLLQMLLEQGGIETCYSLKQVFCGGEVLPVALVEGLLSKLDVNLHNLYGPTEACIDATFWNCKREMYGQIVPIGRAIANTQVYILDENLQPVPIGVPGELHIGGASLARGYLNRRELTAEKFIPNPFDNSKISKLYKTGDLARYLPDGNIEYLGRIDNQVKIRGFRIEPGEIEAVLGQHEDVQASCVIARVDTTGDQRLVAYIVPQSEQTPTVNELRQFLKAKLPDYMVPNAIVILESLPLTPNGKVDRRALKAPSNLSSSDTFVSPRNTVELQLVQIWSKILKVDLVGVKDNFFDLGGHSLLAPSLMAQIKQQFGKDIPLAILFQHPTIEDLASIVQKHTDDSGWSPLVAIQPTGSNPPLFCLPGAGGFPFYLYNLARYLGSNQPFYTFQAQGGDGEFAVISKVEDIAAHYIQAMQAVQPQGPYFLAGHSFGGKVAYEMAQQLLRQGQEVALVVILDTTAPTALAKQEEWDDATWLINFAKVLKTVFAKDLELDADRLVSLDPLEQFKYVLEYLQMLDILPPDADTTYLKQLLQAYKVDGSTEYVPQHVFPIPITLFRACESSSEEQTVLPSELLQEKSWGWSAFSSEPVDIHFVPGNHVTMMTLPHVQVLAERLNACMKQRNSLNVS